MRRPETPAERIDALGHVLAVVGLVFGGIGWILDEVPLWAIGLLLAGGALMLVARRLGSTWW